MNTLFPTLKNEIVVEEKQKKQQKPVFGIRKRMQRNNNRKNTRSRHTQYIVMYDTRVFPPIKHVKCIKHESK